MSFTVSSTVAESLPTHAWGVEVCLKTSKVIARHGNGVEAFCSGGVSGLVEGAWNAPFDLYRFHQATLFIGTGYRIEGGGIDFCSSSDLLCPIFSIRKNGNLYVSNSSVNVMVMAGATPDASYPFYSESFLRVFRQGLYCCDRSVGLSSGDTMQLHFCCIMSLSDGALSYRPYLVDEAPVDFGSYYQQLEVGVTQVLENGRDSSRQRPFGSAAALSTGYDSVATAVLARSAGCRDAFTYCDSMKENPDEDSGSEIAEQLGMACRVFDRWDYLKAEAPAESEFCLLSTSMAVPSYAMAEALSGRIFVGGYHGDVAWGQGGRPECFIDYAMPWTSVASGVSAIEFRLRVGYVPFAPATIGIRHNDAIVRILSSEEMQPWSLGGNYDRPIPRRIGEAAGVSRELFGMTKMATAHAKLRSRKSFTESGWASYQQFYVEEAYAPKTMVFWLRRVQFWCLSVLRYKILRRKDMVVPSSRWQRRFPFLLNRAPHEIKWRFSFMYQWAFSLNKDRYR